MTSVSQICVKLELYNGIITFFRLLLMLYESRTQNTVEEHNQITYLVLGWPSGRTPWV